VREALALNQNYRLHAGIDLSDGLALDLSRLLNESQVGAVIETASIPVSAAAETLSRASGRSPVQHALTDGEDYELLFTTSSQEASRLLSDQPLRVPVTRIGSVVAQSGQWQIDAGGQQSPLPAEGYLH
jgi:thiamine-monophosphate kinase